MAHPREFGRRRDAGDATADHDDRVDPVPSPGHLGPRDREPHGGAGDTQGLVGDLRPVVTMDPGAALADVGHGELESPRDEPAEALCHGVGRAADEDQALARVVLGQLREAGLAFGAAPHSVALDGALGGEFPLDHAEVDVRRHRPGALADEQARRRDRGGVGRGHAGTADRRLGDHVAGTDLVPADGPRRHRAGRAGARAGPATEASPTIELDRAEGADPFGDLERTVRLVAGDPPQRRAKGAPGRPGGSVEELGGIEERALGDGSARAGLDAAAATDAELIETDDLAADPVGRGRRARPRGTIPGSPGPRAVRGIA